MSEFKLKKNVKMAFLNKKRIITDDYYETPDKLIDILINVLKSNIKSNKFLYIDPSVGTGNIFNRLPSKKIAFDINKKKIKNLNNKKCINKDFLKYYPENDKDRIIVIGNPPFSSKGGVNMYIPFINHALEFAEKVIYILPQSVRKINNMEKIVKNGNKLELDVNIPNKYSKFNNKNIKTCIQVWSKGYMRLPKLDTKCNDFILTSVNNGVTPNIYLRRVGTRKNVGMIHYDNTNFKRVPGCDYGIIFKNNNTKKIIEKLKYVYKNGVYNDVINNKFSTSYPSLTKDDIYHIYNNGVYPEYIKSVNYDLYI